jgi:hypothetical protein
MAASKTTAVCAMSPKSITPAMRSWSSGSTSTLAWLKSLCTTWRRSPGWIGVTSRSKASRIDSRASRTAAGSTSATSRMANECARSHTMRVSDAGCVKPASAACSRASTSPEAAHWAALRRDCPTGSPSIQVSRRT